MSLSFFCRAQPPRGEDEKEKSIPNQRRAGKQYRIESETANEDVLKSVHGPRDRGDVADGLECFACDLKWNPRAAETGEHEHGDEGESDSLFLVARQNADEQSERGDAQGGAKDNKERGRGKAQVI